MIVEQLVSIPGSGGAPAYVRLFDGDQWAAGEAAPRSGAGVEVEEPLAPRFEDIVRLTCESMGISWGDFEHQCAFLHYHLRSLVTRSSSDGGSEGGGGAAAAAVHPALCDGSSREAPDDGWKGRGANEGGGELSFLVLGDSHVRVWRLAAARTSVRFTVRSAGAAAWLGVFP